MVQTNLFINPSEFYFVKPTSPYTGEARTEREIASQTLFSSLFSLQFSLFT